MSQVGGEELRRRLRQLEAQIEQVARSVEPGVCDAVREIVQSIMDFHGAGLARIMDIISHAGESGRVIREACGRDSLAGSLLLLYGLHPLDLESRVRLALDGLASLLRSHGCELELLRTSEKAVVLQLMGTAALPPGLRVALEQALHDVAPEVASIEIGSPLACASSMVPLPLVGATPAATDGGPRP
jgi:hypothetical protein